MANENLNQALASESGQQMIAQALQNVGMANVGDMSQLQTSSKTSLVAAVNELANSSITINATLLAASWNSTTHQQTVVFSGYESSMDGVIGMPVSATSTQKEAYEEAKVNMVSMSGNSFTFECENIPAVDLPVTLYVKGVGTGGTGHNYSTTEHVIGTWIDGKPLYEKVLIQDSGIPTGDVEIPHGINNLDEIIFVVGNGCLADGKKILLPLTSRNGNNYNIGITEYDSSSIWVEVGVSYDGVYALDLIKIIIRYTKTIN